jgi:hypothetical protein
MKSPVSSTAMPASEAPLVRHGAPPPGAADGAGAEMPRPEIAGRPSPWTLGRVTALVIGVLLILVSLLLVGAGGAALWADRTQREDGYVTTDAHAFSTPSSALATVSTELGSAGVGWLYSPGLLDDVRIRVTPVKPGQRLFVGIGSSTDVDRYLAGVGHSVITEFWGEETETVEGGAPASPPGAQDFWIASATGRGTQTLEWDPSNGSWTVVVMNADAGPGIDVDADLGARLPGVLWIATGVLIAGVVLLVGGALLVAGAFRRPRHPGS